VRLRSLSPSPGIPALLQHLRSGLTHWRGRIDDKLDLLLQESLRVAHDTGALKISDLSRVTVDTTVQPKNVTHPTDAKLMLKAILQLGTLAKRQGVELRIVDSLGSEARLRTLLNGRLRTAAPPPASPRSNPRREVARRPAPSA
jgi:hypothetical protein